MSKHRKKRHYRQITIAAVAIGAVGVPSVAMACLDGQENAGGRHHGQWKNASADHRWSKGEKDAKPAAKTSPAPAASPSAAKATATASGATARVVELVNDERRKAGCSPLTVNAKLTKAAQDHSKDMADHRNMSHTGSDGSSPEDRITRAGYDWSSYGENVAYGYSTPESVMEGWMTSPGHKRNILDCSFKEIGVGHAQPDDYWTQDFGTAR
ncbi:CAP domain-containing protein [Streptomyces sp. Je 1-4]|uniref:CAP domain-containing protein n=1 Tax=Streptomyces TaxID=1883 RepID=UPI00140F3DA2|nr:MULTISPECIES: CAP domain-containing protein [unclassified Streptomyces]QIK10726.1 CAP domain-containing protein [Streptomyces sp. ID38640]UYB44544.1 CAP domain-containing protein [Streptomyces sp. Je 1-4]UZQ41006.1 CAP domain-containing protein [Streptomyces sp. Je 1-4] [Streptomyces sp. Je 1-4 4N24]UZQ48423.1 CAP domain-containing protein [Streptomyces sp. Je 1-4] [Streptomyces sp. Je 1-4 4N24_ara]